MDNPFFLVFLLAVTCAALFHLGARATITSFIHRRYPPALANFMNCATCAGTWYGVIVAGVYGLSGGGVDGIAFRWPGDAIAGGVLGMILTPAVAWLHETALRALSDAPEIEVDTEPAVSPKDEQRPDVSMLTKDGFVRLPPFVVEGIKAVPGEFVYFIKRADGRFEMINEATMDKFLGSSEAL